MKTWSDRIRGMGVVGLLLAAWQLLSQFEVVSASLLPSLFSVMRAFGRLLLTLELPLAAMQTLLRCIGGYVGAAIIAIPIGIWMGRSHRMRVLLEPLVELLRPIPSAAVIPIAIIFLGIGDSMKVFIVAFGCSWPILLNTLAGVQAVDPMLLETGTVFGFRGRQLLRHVVVPAAMPSIFTGLRISLAIALILAITAEMIAGNSGLGFLILDYERAFRYPDMYAGVFSLGVLGFCLNLAFVRLQARFLGWMNSTD